MYKKVSFVTNETDEDRYNIVQTVLTEGYSEGAFYCETNGDETTITFNVNRFDLKDLRHDVQVLVKGGLSVREVEAD